MSLATCARPARPLTHQAAPGLSRALPSLSLSSRGCPSGPRGPSFSSRSSCPLLSSQTALCQGKREQKADGYPKPPSQNRDHCAAAPALHPAPPLWPRLGAAWDLGGRELWRAREQGNGPGEGKNASRTWAAVWSQPTDLGTESQWVGRLPGGEWAEQGPECQAEEPDVRVARTPTEASRGLGSSPDAVVGPLGQCPALEGESWGTLGPHLRSVQDHTGLGGQRSNRTGEGCVGRGGGAAARNLLPASPPEAREFPE